ncbi:MAG TPA: energy transducer TonB [Armatimonadota bacterium]
MARIHSSMFPKRFWLLLVLLLVLGELVSAQAPMSATGKADASLVFADADSGAPLFTLSDILRFDWDRQLCELTPESATRLLALPVVQQRDFIVKDHEGVIYRGRFSRSSSNIGYDGPTILIDQGATKALPASPFVTISGGYPTGGGAHDRDRFSPRVYTLLAKAGVLASIPDDELPTQRLWSGHAWVGGEQVIKASAVLFPGTFRVGKTAYTHVLLFKGQHPDFAFDKLVVTATCSADGGKFSSKQEILTITPPLLDNGIYICRFRPWEGSVLRMPDDQANVPASVTVFPPLSYPKDALNESREGVVIVTADVDEAGKLASVEVQQGAGSADFDRSAVRAVQRATFTPALFDGHPTRGEVRLQVVFAKGKGSYTVLPPDPVKVTAKPGPMEITFTVVAFQKDGATFTPIGNWTLPPRQIMLLPAMAPAPDVAPAK